MVNDHFLIKRKTKTFSDLHYWRVVPLYLDSLCPRAMSVLLERLEKEGEVPLERYGHQVGGRQLFLKYRDCLCKPLIPRERFFYQTAPAAVRRYIPQYFGKEEKEELICATVASLCLSLEVVVVHQPGTFCCVCMCRSGECKLCQAAIWGD